MRPPELPRLSSRRVIYTAIVGGKDKLRDPGHVMSGVDYVCFTDTPGITSRVFSIRPLPWVEKDARLTARRLKLMPHLLFPEYGESMWLDGSKQLRRDVSTLWRQALEGAHMAAFAHPYRHCAYEEAEDCLRNGRDSAEALRHQMERYRQQGLPADRELFETSVLWRRHHSPKVISAMELWWQELVTHSQRDQVSLPYVLWRTNLPVRALDFAAAHDVNFLHFPHLWYPQGDDRSQLKNRLRAWLYVLSQRTGMQQRYERLRAAQKAARKPENQPC
ncbi:MAG: DUF616 domain-containing protein [Proteobacteria bacterium]|nr:DUF616 domain-containing protein [Pseudomonadota bacterium]